MLVFGLSVAIASLNLFFRDLERDDAHGDVPLPLTPIVYSELVPAHYRAFISIVHLSLSGVNSFSGVCTGPPWRWDICTPSSFAQSDRGVRLSWKLQRWYDCHADHVSDPTQSGRYRGLKGLRQQADPQRFRKHRFTALNGVSFEVSGESLVS
jgi:hypothetical protein